VLANEFPCAIPADRRPCSRTVPGKMLVGYGAARGVHGLVRRSASAALAPMGGARAAAVSNGEALGWPAAPAMRTG
jgi:hypothetical protein